jgi:hypothetical protein
MPMLVAVAVTVIATTLMWGPVSRGLHEESVARWCTWSASADEPIAADVETSVSMCVQRALSDPEYLTAVRGSL